MLNFQTSTTPNVLDIYLLNKVMEQRVPIKTIDQQLLRRAQDLYGFFEESAVFSLLVTNPEVRSPTVIALQGKEKVIDEVKKSALRHDILLGNGYGPWAKNTFRIANFPAHTDEEFDRLKSFFQTYYH
jgi:phosphoserine aminotransferase